LNNLAQTGAVFTIWDEKTSLAEQLQTLLGSIQDAGDQRDRLGKHRNGRPKAADIAERVHDLALQSK
jgi:malonate decarboxylase gamma subunit